MKKCFKCGEKKPLLEFYRHARMADGHLNKCKTCTKTDVTRHRSKNLDRIREYDRGRDKGNTTERSREYRERHPKKFAAHTAVNSAVRSGRLTSQPCEVCKDVKSTAHHDDYDKHLSVRWLCQVHHTAWHKEHGEGANAH